jgi:hypothetical protein
MYVSTTVAQKDELGGRREKKMAHPNTRYICTYIIKNRHHVTA